MDTELASLEIENPDVGSPPRWFRKKVQKVWAKKGTITCSAIILLIISLALWRFGLLFKGVKFLPPPEQPSSPPMLAPVEPPRLPPFRTLSSIPESMKITTSHKILEFSINNTVLSVESLVSKIPILFINHELNSHEKNALKDCMEMLDQTLHELRQAVQELQKFSESTDYLPQFYSEINKLLVAAITNENKCISDIEEADPDDQKGLKDFIQDLWNPISWMISNCSAIVKQIETTENVHKMTAKDRKLMQITPKIRPSIIVASNDSQNYRNFSKAVGMASNFSTNRYDIKIKAGAYEEKVEISKEKPNIMLVGDGTNSTLSMTENRLGAQKQQAAAIRVTSDSAFHKCSFTLSQDTLYGDSVRQFYRECTIQGTVDFIFGDAAAVFQDCHILVEKPNPGQMNMSTAQGREDPNQNTLISLHNCTVIASRDLARAGNGNSYTSA